MTSPPVPVVYIAGIGRSGSTLLARTLGRLPGWLTTGELMHLFGRGMAREERCSCGTPVPRCGVWGPVVEDLRREGLPHDPQTLDAFRHRVTEGRALLRPFLPHLAPALRRDLESYRSLMSRVYARIRDTTGCSVIVDSSKSVSQARILTEVPGIRLHLVHLVRDSRGVVFSLGKKVRRPGTSKPGARLDHRSAPVGALLWNGANLLAERLAPRVASYSRIRYRDFVRDPGGQVVRVLEAVDAAPRPPSLPTEGSVVHLGADHVLAGNPVRADRGPVQLREDVEWREAMPAPTRWLVTLLTLPLLKRYGLGDEQTSHDPAPAVPAARGR